LSYHNLTVTLHVTHTYLSSPSFFFHPSAPHRDLHSFPTRRSSDLRPVVRRTWAPRGHPPVLTHTGGNWSRLSIAAALAFRWDGRRRRCYFQTRPGRYNDLALIGFLRALKRHFPGRHIILVCDGPGGHP